jgi:hypothetical protein
MPRLAARPGFAIPTALLVGVLLLLMLTAAFSLVSVERKVADDARAGTDALALAESGLERFIVGRSSMGFTGVPAESESTRVVLAHGYADVVLKRIRPPNGAVSGLYLIRSSGVRTTQRVANSVDAHRSVVEYASWVNGTLGTNAAWTSLSGLQKNGGSGTLSGIDACGGASVAGVAVPTVPGYSQNGGASVPAGTPPILSLGTQPQAQQATKIDWNGVVGGTAFTPDVSLPGGSWPSFADPAQYPAIMVDGDFTLPGSGRGLLIVTGKLTLNGNLNWDGVILVGSNLVSNGNNQVTGAVVTGLNDKIGAGTAVDTIGVNTIGNGNKLFQFNSCSVTKALAAFGRLVPYNNTWADDWATF